ncbi:hypothetical protein CJI97_005021 [Candidozyma auris]|nr:hypothetical protein CJI97_005021 [[Candida] auris]
MAKVEVSVECEFCKKRFGSKSTLGRHLDSRKGDVDHPEEEIQKIRANVVRRGKKRDVALSKARRQKVSRAYNSSENVREKNKLRRKRRDKRISARLKATDWFLDKLTRQAATEKTQLDFPSFIATYLGPSQWPKDGNVPTGDQFNCLIGKIEGGLSSIDLNRLFSAYGAWTNLYIYEQEEAWQRAVEQALRRHLGDTSLWEVSGAKELVAQKQEEVLSGGAELVTFEDDETPG